VPFTAPICLKLKLLQQLIVKNLRPKFHENLTGVLVADSRPRTEGCGFHIWHSVLPYKECQKSVLREYELTVCVAYFGIPKCKMCNFLSSFLLMLLTHLVLSCGCKFLQSLQKLWLEILLYIFLAIV